MEIITVIVSSVLAVASAIYLSRRPKDNRHYEDYYANILSKLYEMVCMLDDPASSEIDNFYEGALAIIRQQTKDVPHKLVLLVRDLGSATGQQKIDKYVKLRAAVIAQRQYWKGILGYPSDDFNTRTLLGRELGDGLMMLAGWLLIGSTVCMWVVVPMTVYLAVPETFLKTLLTGLSVFLVYGAIILMILSLITLLTAAFLLLIKPLLCNKKR